MRSLDPAFQQRVEARLQSEVAARELPVFCLPPDRRSCWPQILEATAWRLLDPPQLPLF